MFLSWSVWSWPLILKCIDHMTNPRQRFSIGRLVTGQTRKTRQESFHMWSRDLFRYGFQLKGGNCYSQSHKDDDSIVKRPSKHLSRRSWMLLLTFILGLDSIHSLHALKNSFTGKKLGYTGYICTNLHLLWYWIMDVPQVTTSIIRRVANLSRRFGDDLRLLNESHQPCCRPACRENEFHMVTQSLAQRDQFCCDAPAAPLWIGCSSHTSSSN